MSRQSSEQFSMAQTISGPQHSTVRNSDAMQPRQTPLRKLRPSSNVGPGPIRRPLFRSQIPIRAHIEGRSDPGPLPHKSHVLAQRMLNVKPFLASQQSQLDENQNQNVLQNVTKAFSIYDERVQADLSEIRSVCTTLVVQEHEEKKRLHSLCIRIMRERDLARQRVQALLREQSAFSSPPPASPDSSRGRGEKRGREAVVGAGADAAGSGGSGNAAADATSEGLSPKSRPICSLRTSPMPSPLGSPQLHQLPYPLPPAALSSSNTAPPSSSASDGSNSSFPLASSSTVANAFNYRSGRNPSSHPPKSEYPGINSDNGTGTSASCPPVKRRKSCDSTHSSSSTAVDSDSDIGGGNPYSYTNAGADRNFKIALPEPHRHPSPVTSISTGGEVGLAVPFSGPLPPAHSLLMMRADASATASVNSGVQVLPSGNGIGKGPGPGPGMFLTGTFPHVDIMYLPMDGNLMCRACLLDSSKGSSRSRSSSNPPSASAGSSTPPSTPPSSASSVPTTKAMTPTSASAFGLTKFPKTASWDELRDHCVDAHPRECADVNRLHPAELFELRRRLNL